MPSASTSDLLDPLFRAYLRELGRVELLSAEQERCLARQAAAGSRAAHDALVVANLRFVVAVARRHLGRGLPLPDLVAEGNLGLLEAVARFNPDAGCRFTTYAWWWVTEGIRSALRNQPALVRVPARMAQRMRRWRRAAHELRERHGREPSSRELAAALDLSRLAAARVEAALATSGRSPLAAGNSSPRPLEELPDEGTGHPGEAAAQHEEVAGLRRALARLGAREQRILRLRFGLDGGEPRNLRDVGARLDLSHERVRLLERRALARLRASLAAHAPGAGSAR
jgi:RNA polymerase primary sigma factor